MFDRYALMREFSQTFSASTAHFCGYDFIERTGFERKERKLEIVAKAKEKK
jgi:hypothetical protein